MSNQIEFEIVTRLDSVEKSLKSLEDKSKQTGDKLDKNLGSGLNASISKSFKAIAVTATAAVAGIGVFFAKSIQAASEQEIAVNKLNQSLASAGTFSEAASLSIQKFADEIQRTTTVSNDTTISLVAMARNFTRSNDEAVKLTRAAVELSAATGTSLDGAVKNLGKTFGGLTGELGEAIPALRTLTKEQLQAGQALDFVLARFGGSAASKINTFAGSTEQLKNTFNDFLQSIGNLFIRSPKFVALLTAVSGELVRLAEAFIGLTDKGGDPVGQATQNFVKFSLVLNDIVIGTITSVVNNLKAFGIVFTAAVDLINGGLAALSGGGNFKMITDNFKKELDRAGQLLVEETISDKVGEALTRIQDKINNAPPISESIKNNLTNGVPENINATRVSIESLFNPIDSSNLVSTFEQLKNGTLVIDATTKDATKNSVEYFKQMASSINGVVNNLIATGFARLGAALVGAEGGFAGFAKAAAGILGDFFIQMGTTIIAADAAIIALKASLLSFFGGGGIAAGIGLVIAGGALKALSGGPATTTLSGSSGGGVAGGGLSSPVGETVTSFNETELAEPGTQVAVNINGNVLGDKRTLGIAVAEAINEAFGSDGAIIARGALA